VQNKAMWHKNCYLKFSQEKLEKARKRNATDSELESESSSYGSKRFCPPCHLLDKENCEESSGKLHNLAHWMLIITYVL